MRRAHLLCLISTFATAACGGGSGGAGSGSTVTPKFDVTWAPDTVVVPAADAKAHLMPGPAADASTLTYVFDAQAAAIAALQPGQVVALGGVAYRRVVAVTTLPDGTIQLDTDRTTLPEAITSGTLAWSKKVDFGSPDVMSSMVVTYAGRALDVTRRAVTGAITYDGDIGDYHVSLTFTPSGNSVAVNVVTKNADQTVGVEASGSIQGFDVDGQATIGSGGVTFQAGSHQLEGTLHVHGIATNTGIIDTMPLNIPLGIEIPIEIGPVPLILAIKAAVNITLGLDLADSSAEASADIHFTSNDDLSASSVTGALQVSASTGSGDFSGLGGGSAALDQASMTACLEAPRLELSVLGEFASVALTQNNCVYSAFTFSPACNEVRSSIVGIALANLGFFGITLASGQGELYSTHNRITSGDCGPDM